MLKQLRDKKIAKKIWIGLAIIVVPAFIWWGSGSLRSPEDSGPTVAGKIFGRNVSFIELREAVDGVRTQMIMQFGDSFNEMQKYLDIETQAWDRLLLLAQAKKSRIRVSDKETIEFIQKLPFLQSKGAFDQRTYEQALRWIFRTQARAFEEQIRQNLIISKLYDSLTASITVSDAEIKEEYEKNNEQISVSYLAATFQDFAQEINPTEDELKEYFEKNSLLFKQPLSFNLEYVTLPAEGKDQAARDAQLNKYQDIFLKNESNFAAVAAEAKLDLKETGLFAETDPIPGIGWSTQVSSSLPKLKAGQILPAVRIDQNDYIIRLKERREPAIADFTAAKDKVKEAYQKEKARALAIEKIEAAQKEISTGGSPVDLETLAKKTGLKSGVTASFKFGGYIEGVGASDNFFLIARQLKDNQTSQIIKTESGYYIIRPKERIPVDENKFAAEKKEFGEKLLSSRKQESFNKFYDGLRKKGFAR